MDQALSFYWGLLLAALMLAAIMRREQITNWAWWVTTPKLAYAGAAVLLLVAALRFIVGGV